MNHLNPLNRIEPTIEVSSEMIEFWFGVTAVMLAAYVILDGFDLGAGALHLFVARTDAERRQVLAAIGPFWDGNEVWLLALGGVLFVAFPHVLASGLSGFYFAIFLVLWSLMLRAVSLEFRSHLESRLWRAAWDTVFCVVSAVLPVLFGVALGNLLRGVPLDTSGWFAISLFTDFSASDPVGLLDWYTVLVGVFALVALLAHGALFLAWKTDQIVQARARACRNLVLSVRCHPVARPHVDHDRPFSPTSLRFSFAGRLRSRQQRSPWRDS